MAPRDFSAPWTSRTCSANISYSLVAFLLPLPLLFLPPFLLHLPFLPLHFPSIPHPLPLHPPPFYPTFPPPFSPPFPYPHDRRDPLRRLLNPKVTRVVLSELKHTLFSCRFRLVLSPLCIQHSLGLLVTASGWSANLDCCPDVSSECGKPQIQPENNLLTHNSISQLSDMELKTFIITCNYLDWRREFKMGHVINTDNTDNIIVCVFFYRVI